MSKKSKETKRDKIVFYKKKSSKKAKSKRKSPLIGEVQKIKKNK